MSEKKFNIIIGENGRMIIPAQIRKELDLKAGDEMVVKLSQDNDIVIHSPKQSLKKLQGLFRNSQKISSIEFFQNRIQQ
ncbi:MAG: AbrB/MazE/SpoVT family DNA-binding domain-containing protein [Alphaproteobacteria bacterium]